ncbi:hypothetical protein BDQ17DRAFT_1347220, partial [Cyathus striatus]
MAESEIKDFMKNLALPSLQRFSIRFSSANYTNLPRSQKYYKYFWKTMETSYSFLNCVTRTYGAVTPVHPNLKTLQFVNYGGSINPSTSMRWKIRRPYQGVMREIPVQRNYKCDTVLITGISSSSLKEFVNARKRAHLLGGNFASIQKLSMFISLDEDEPQKNSEER